MVAAFGVGGEGADELVAVVDVDELAGLDDLDACAGEAPADVDVVGAEREDAVGRDRAGDRVGWVGGLCSVDSGWRGSGWEVVVALAWCLVADSLVGPVVVVGR